MDELAFASMGQFRDNYFPNMCKEDHKPKHIVTIRTTRFLREGSDEND